MNTYFIRARRAPLPVLTGRVFDPGEDRFCREHPFAAIDCYPWDESGYRPEARAYAAIHADGFSVLLCAKEPRVHAETRQFGGPVYQDSCLEFFLQPFVDDGRYINLECNAQDAMLIGLGRGREDRRGPDRMPGELHLTASLHDGAWWAVAYELPFSFLEAMFSRPFTASGEMRGNFYKCEERTSPHFGCWNPIRAPRPDFHRPECFGRLLY